MAARLVSVGALGVGLALSGTAQAGPWFEGRGGAGVAAGHYEFEKEYLDSKTGQRAIARDEGGPFGVAFGLGVVGGWALNRQAALGLTGRVELTPYIESANPRYASLDLHLLGAVGSTFAFRPARSLELRIAPEWAFARFAGSRQDIGADDNVYEFENVSGPGLGFSLGYVSEPGFGFATAANLALLSSEHQKLSLLTFSLLASYSIW